MVDEERLIAFSDGEVRGLAGLQRQPFQMIVAEADERLAPILIAREAPDGWAENVVFAAGRIGQKSAALERVRETEGATAIDAEQHGELSERHGLVTMARGATRGTILSAAATTSGRCRATRWSMPTPAFRSTNVSARSALDPPGPATASIFGQPGEVGVWSNWKDGP